MKTITNYLFKVRQKAILSDLKLFGWKIYTTILFFFLFALIIENIFYLSTEIRTNALIIFSSILLIFFMWITETLKTNAIAFQKTIIAFRFPKVCLESLESPQLHLKEQTISSSYKLKLP